MKITVLQNTFLKRNTKQSSELQDNEKIAVSKGDILDVTWVNDITSKDHYQIALHTPIKGFFNWFVFKQHVQINGNKKLSDSDFTKAAKELGLEEAHIRALVEVESGGSGFLPSGRPKILCEGQYFSLFTDDKYNNTHPQISYPKWDRTKYYGGEKEWERFEAMYKLNSNAAIKATSFGLFQILGMNHAACGYSTPQEYFTAMQENEEKHLFAFLNFIKSQGLVKYLQTNNWAEFSRRYNGQGYKANQYDTKLAKAFKKYS